MERPFSVMQTFHPAFEKPLPPFQPPKRKKVRAKALRQYITRRENRYLSKLTHYGSPGNASF